LLHDPGYEQFVTSHIDYTCHTYVEPFGGSARILLSKPTQHQVEVWNDSDPALYDLMMAVKLGARDVFDSMYNTAHLGLVSKRVLEGLHQIRENWDASVERLHLVSLTCDDAFSVMGRMDSPETMFYIDPPYVPDTRQASVYDRDMGQVLHSQLLAVCHDLNGAIAITGHDHPIYEFLDHHGWTRHGRPSPTSLNGEREHVWTNQTNRATH